MTTSIRKRLLFWVPLLAVIAASLVWLLRPQAVTVDLAIVEQGPLQVSVDDEGQTRVKDVFVVSAPVGGLMRRIDLDAGDAVEADETVIARIESSDPVFLDIRTETALFASVRAAEAVQAHAQAELARAEAEREFARTELERAERLKTRDTISQSALDEALWRARAAAASVDEAKANLTMRESELERARARLLPPSEARRKRLDCDCIDVRSPVSGQVLRILAQSEGVITQGQALVEIGDPTELEIVSDLLSSDAVRIEPGHRVVVHDWGGSHPLSGTVRRVEPFGFTKISALGIEEQRVNVIIDLNDTWEQWSRLGHGYSVSIEIVVWESKNTLQLPLTALFRHDGAWTVFIVEGQTARLREVDVGRQSGTAAQIVSGLSHGDTVVAYPGDRLRDGVRVSARE